MKDKAQGLDGDNKLTIISCFSTQTKQSCIVSTYTYFSGYNLKRSTKHACCCTCLLL